MGNRVFTKRCGEGVAAGMNAREHDVIVEVDDEALWDELALAQYIVRVQAKERSVKSPITYDYMNGVSHKLSEVMSARSAPPMTKEGAVKVFANQNIENKIEMLYDLGQDTEGIRKVLDNLLAKDKITQEDYDLGNELLDMSNE